MKIGISANTSWNLVNFRLKLMQALRSEGHEVVAIAPRDDSSARIEKEGFRFVPLHKLTRKGSNPLQDFQLKNEYESIFASENLDAVLLYTIKPVIYGNIAKRKTPIYSISTITGLGYTFLNKGIRPAVAKRLYKGALKYCDHIFFQNEDDRTLFEKLRILKPNVAHVINGSGIDTDEIQPSTHISSDGQIKFLFVGRMLIDKGVRELLNAFRELFDRHDRISLTLVGGLDFENPSMVPEKEFKALIDHQSVHYLGERSDVIDIMKEVDVVVLPSYREGIPRVLLEAMTLARPIVTTNVPGCRQVIDDNINGYRCEARSSEDLKQKLEKMISLPEADRIGMGKSGREKAEKVFDQKKISAEYIRLLDQLNIKS